MRLSLDKELDELVSINTRLEGDVQKLELDIEMAEGRQKAEVPKWQNDLEDKRAEHEVARLKVVEWKAVHAQPLDQNVINGIKKQLEEAKEKWPALFPQEEKASEKKTK